MKSRQHKCRYSLRFISDFFSAGHYSADLATYGRCAVRPSEQASVKRTTAYLSFVLGGSRRRREKRDLPKSLITNEKEL